MKKLPIDMLQSGMIVARNIFYSGRIMLPRGTVLSRKYIDDLDSLGFTTVWVKDESLGIQESGYLEEETRIDAINKVRQIYSTLEDKFKTNISNVSSSVDSIIDQVLDNRDVLISLSDVHSFDDYIFAHSVNVCILSVATGLSLDYPENKLRELGIGALFHDVGMTNVDPEIVRKITPLTEEEKQSIRLHPRLGYEILLNLPEVSIASATIALQHHERWDSTGYPSGIGKGDIHEYAIVVSIADMFDALICDRPYRNAFSVTEALRILSNTNDRHFSSPILKAFTSNIAIFPVGTLISLNTGESGIVVDVHKKNPTRPIVKIISDVDHKLLDNPKEIDLSRTHNTFIVGIPDDIVDLI
ncbi:MAG: HD-GYP domain-containing protein [Candidatus Saccharibacteria bacterium]